MSRFWRMYDAAARWSDRIAVPIICAMILAPVFFADLVIAIGMEIMR